MKPEQIPETGMQTLSAMTTAELHVLYRHLYQDEPRELSDRAIRETFLADRVIGCAFEPCSDRVLKVFEAAPPKSAQPVEPDRRVWVHVGRHVDGRWVKGFHTCAKALDSLRAFVPDAPTEAQWNKTEHRSFVDDNGGSHYVTQLDKGMTTEIYRRLLTAYDARETGTATPVQTALLDKWHF